MVEEKIMCHCAIPDCNRAFQMGPHVYEGRYIPRYNLTVCKACYEGNWDGWHHDYEKFILAHLKKKGLPVPERNQNDLLPRD